MVRRYSCGAQMCTVSMGKVSNEQADMEGVRRPCRPGMRAGTSHSPHSPSAQAPSSCTCCALPGRGWWGPSPCSRSAASAGSARTSKLKSKYDVVRESAAVNQRARDTGSFTAQSSNRPTCTAKMLHLPCQRDCIQRQQQQAAAADPPCAHPPAPPAARPRHSAWQQCAGRGRASS